MSTYTDFKGGLTSIDQYLEARHHINEELVSSPEHESRVVLKTERDFNMREILCNLLAGNGLKLPNLQICLYTNLNALLEVENLQEELRQALEEMRETFEQFMDHTNLENVLGRINEALDEVTQVANMVNFCATPIDPKAITNVLEGIMESYLGAGEFLTNLLGEMFPDEVSACLSSDGSFNAQIFKAGLLGELASNWERVSSGQLLQNEVDDFVTQIQDVREEFDTLMRFENNVAGYYSQGGSASGPIDPSVNKKLGVLHNPESGGIARNAQLASQLKTSFDRLAGYPVIDNEGNEYNNIFELFLEPDLLELLSNENDPTPLVTGDQQPVYNYCGELIGYTTPTLQAPENTRSKGAPPSPSSSPGYNAGGLPTQTDGIRSGPVSVDDEEGNPNPSGDTSGDTDSGSSSPTRTTATGTVENITPDTDKHGEVELEKTYVLMKLRANYDCWVRMYTSRDARDADTIRNPGSGLSVGYSGLIYEKELTAGQDWWVTPGVIGFNEADDKKVYLSIRNLESSVESIDVEFTYLKIG